MVEKLAKQIKEWKTKLLSRAWKDVLLRTVAQSMPNYLMSLFLLPMETCRDWKLMSSFVFGIWFENKQRCEMDEVAEDGEG